MGIKKKVATRVEYNGTVLEKGLSLDMYRAPSSSRVWSVTIADWEYGMQEALKPKRTKPGNLPSERLSIRIYTEEGMKEFTDLVLLSRRLVGDPENGAQVVLSGKDLSHMLYLDNQTKQTYENQTGYFVTTDLLEDSGITDYSFATPLGTHLSDNFPLAQMDIQRDRYINRIQTLLNECGAVWQMNGTEFVAWIPDSSIKPIKTFYGNDLYGWNFEESVMELYDKVKVTRINKNSNVALMQEGYKTDRQYAGLSGTFYSVQLQVLRSSGCTIENPDWFYQGHHQGSGFNLLGPVDQVYFTVSPQEGATSFYWNVKVIGIPEAYQGTGIDITTSYKETLSGTEGEHPAPDIQSNFTPNNTLAELKAKAFLREQGTLRNTATLPVPIQIPEIDLKDRIKVKLTDTLEWNYNITGIRTVVQGHEGWEEISVKSYEV